MGAVVDRQVKRHDGVAAVDTSSRIGIGNPFHARSIGLSVYPSEGFAFRHIFVMKCRIADGQVQRVGTGTALFVFVGIDISATRCVGLAVTRSPSVALTGGLRNGVVGFGIHSDGDIIGGITNSAAHHLNRVGGSLRGRYSEGVVARPGNELPVFFPLVPWNGERADGTDRTALISGNSAYASTERIIV